MKRGFLNIMASLCNHRRQPHNCAGLPPFLSAGQGKARTMGKIVRAVAVPEASCGMGEQKEFYTAKLTKKT